MAELLLTTDAMREADARTIAAGTPGTLLMERAGRAVADAVRAMLPPPRPVLVACGPGNNGGDGFVAARLLSQTGYAAIVALLGARDRLRGDAAEMAALWQGPVLPAAEARPLEVDLVVDALFGAGLDRDLEGAAAALVTSINASGKPVLAVDVPSGIDGDTGRVRGVAVKAARTITFARRKPGHLLLPGRLYCGPVTVADIGIADATVAELDARTFGNGPELWRAAFPRPGLEAHKYKRGHAVVVSGRA